LWFSGDGDQVLAAEPGDHGAAPCDGADVMIGHFPFNFDIILRVSAENEPTRQPIALTVPSYKKMKQDQLLSYEHSLTMQNWKDMRALHGNFSRPAPFSSPTTYFLPSEVRLHLTEHSNAMPASERCPG
jgi:hypothetical protein